jgi:hypothetical protein
LALKRSSIKQCAAASKSIKDAEDEDFLPPARWIQTGITPDHNRFIAVQRFCDIAGKAQQETRTGDCGKFVLV